MVELVSATLDVKEFEAYDCLVIITPPAKGFLEKLSEGIQTSIKNASSIDENITNHASMIFSEEAPGKRVVISPTGSLDDDFADAHYWYNAGLNGLNCALQAGARKPLFFIHGATNQEHIVALLGAYEANYRPLSVREYSEKHNKVVKPICSSIAVCSGHKMMPVAVQVSKGLYLARDLAGGDPERMTPPLFAEYVQKAFEGSNVKVEVISDRKALEDGYPLLAAVDRGVAYSTPRHQARIVHLSYDGGKGEQDAVKTLYLVGKGVCYDTGGHDLKVNGHMPGMHRDKSGASAIAGFFKLLAEAKPVGLRCFGALALVRNAVGPDAYVPDEVIVSRAGVRVRVTNTDFEGRLAMADLLCACKERALADGATDSDTHMYTIATLTLEAYLNFGESYTAAMDNGPARAKTSAEQLREAGAKIGDFVEVANVRKEDFQNYRSGNVTEDIYNVPPKPAMEKRGYTGPAAFLMMATRLDEHGTKAEQPLSYTHLDIAGSGKLFEDIPSGAPLAALASLYVLPKLGIEW